MNRSDELGRLKTVLVNRRAALLSALKGDLAELRDWTAASGDLADFALDSGVEETSCQMLAVESRELMHIDHAISRFNEGDYGTCAGCSKAIPLARLQALPYATLCISCQTKLEKAGFEDWSEMPDDAYDESGIGRNS